MSFDALNAYRIMWVFVFFDLPVETKKQRKQYATWRKNLMRDGFSMLQYSIYMRHCASRENAAVHIKRVKNWLPPQGEVIIFELTDKQFGMMEIFRSGSRDRSIGAPQQLELF